MKSNTHLYAALVLLTGLNLFNYMDRYVLASIVPPLKAELHLSDGEIGWLTSSFMIGYFATSPVFGYLGDRWQRKGLIAFGILSWSAGTILSGFSHQYWTLLGCRVLVGLGEASYAVLAPAWLSDLFPTERRNNALTIFYAATPLGSALGYVVGGLAVAGGNWRNGFLWAGVPGLLLALALLNLTEPARGAPEGPAGCVSAASSRKPGIGGIVSLFRIGDFNLNVLGLTAYTFAMGAFAAWAPTWLNRVHGIDLSTADQFFGGALVIGGLLGTLIGGFAATAWRRKARAGYALLLTLAASMTFLAATATLVSTGSTAPMVCLGAAIFLAFLPMGPINTLLIESVPVTLRASAIAASIFVIHLFGDFWSPVLVGRLADWGYRADNPGAGLERAMVVLPVAFGIAALFWGWLAWRQHNRLVR
jgi:MFS transporter, Spinster family, sphingosine-1-phosphate transporter